MVNHNNNVRLEYARECILKVKSPITLSLSLLSFEFDASDRRRSQVIARVFGALESCWTIFVFYNIITINNDRISAINEVIIYHCVV